MKSAHRVQPFPLCSFITYIAFGYHRTATPCSTGYSIDHAPTALRSGKYGLIIIAESILEFLEQTITVLGYQSCQIMLCIK